MHAHVLPGLSPTVQSPESKLPRAGTGARNSTKAPEEGKLDQLVCHD